MLVGASEPAVRLHHGGGGLAGQPHLFLIIGAACGGACGRGVDGFGPSPDGIIRFAGLRAPR
ncbi:hypothetical protein GCM10011504_56770 [Siccirubricoccus deserti]|nr:hypothetical protein GCM10011504_56770 [Siccirubricoccus deserti]